MTKEQWCAYLPYGLQIECLDHKIDYVGMRYDRLTGISQWDKSGERWSLLTEGGSKPALDRARPLLRPLSDLTQPITVDGETFVPIVRLFETVFTHDDCVYGDAAVCIRAQDSTSKLELSFRGDSMCFWVSQLNELGHDWNPPHNQLELFQLLFKWHFNVFNLPESDYIKIQD